MAQCRHLDSTDIPMILIFLVILCVISGIVLKLFIICCHFRDVLMGLERTVVSDRSILFKSACS